MYRPRSSLFLQGKWHKKLHPCSLAVHRCDSAIGVQLDSAERTRHHQPTSIWARGHGFIAYQVSYESASRLNLFVQNIGHRAWHWGLVHTKYWTFMCKRTNLSALLSDMAVKNWPNLSAHVLDLYRHMQGSCSNPCFINLWSTHRTLSLLN